MSEDVTSPQARIKSFVNRLNRIQEEMDERSGDMKEIYKEAKGEGYDTKALKKVIRIMKEDRQKYEQETMVIETYLNAVAGSTPNVQP